MNIGVVGVGSMGQNHARVLSEMGYLEAIIDSDEDVAEEVGKNYDVPWFTDLDEMLELDLDGVTVATPASTRTNICSEIIDRELNLLVEKPLALTSSEGEELVEKAEKNDVVLSVGMIERHNPVVSSTKALIDEGNIGDVITISSKRVSSFPTRVSDMGVIMDLAIHDIDVMRYLVESEISSVYTIGGPANSDSEFEDNANIMIQFENGINGVLEVNWLTPHKVRKLSITCSNDYLEVDYIDQTLVVTSAEMIEYDRGNLFDIPLEHNIRRFSVKRQEPLKREMKDFVGSIKGEHDSLVDGRDALQSLKVVEAAQRSLEQGKEIKL